ncbi:MAG: periplasmic heavy metal sensor [Chlorobiaceae bacterium]|nr:periplasmic heavy metal sensor [Chlorobiaceae bacterium]
MDFLSSKRFITTALVVLVLLNLSLMGVIWWQNYVSSSYQTVKVTRYYSGSRQAKTQLNLTEEQQRAFRELRREHFRKTMPSLQRILELKQELIAEAVKPSPDKQKLAAIADSLGKRQTLLETALANHFHDLAELCTPAQRDSLEKMLSHIHTARFRRMASWRDRSPLDRHFEMKPERPQPAPNQ